MDGGLNLRDLLQQNAWGEGKGMLRQGQVLKDCYWMRSVDTT